ncbi:MAG: hypothetical protein ABJA71_02160 [Ginsengibacter sp.]
MKFKTPVLFCAFILPLIIFAQRITYSVPEKDDYRTLNFEVIGKIGGNFLVYKNIRNKDAVSVYDNGMQLKERVDLDFIPDRTINVDFIPYPDYFFVIYQYQRRSILYCMGAKLGPDGKKIGEPIQLDTTYINVFADNKIYSTVFSEDKQRIMIYKIQKKNEKFNFTTLLFNPQLQLQNQSRWVVPYEERRDVYNDFFVDNDGNFVFAKSEKTGSRELISKVFLITKAALSDTFAIHELKTNGSYLDEIKLKVDNINNKYLLNSFYYSQKRGNVEGLFTAVWDKQTNVQTAENAIKFDDTLKQSAKMEGALRLAFNDFFIKQVILKKDGGFILTGEDYYTQSRGNPWNRLDYLYGYPYFSSYNYYMYSPSSYWYRPRGYYNSSQTRYYYNNIVVLDIDKDGKLIWSNVLHKSQYDDETDNFLSYQIMNAGGELHFLFNELERRNQLIADQSILPDGTLKRNPTLKSLDKGYQFMPRLAKQVSARQIIVPCTLRNYVCFAKIDY